MTKRHPATACIVRMACGLACAAALTPARAEPVAARRNDFPTVDRVEFVLQCAGRSSTTGHPAAAGEARVGSGHETMAKCSCAIDAIAARVSHAEWVELQTWSNARLMAGERGSQVRENPVTAGKVRRYRELMASGRRDCFLPESTDR